MLFNVIIPTRERPSTLEFSLRSVLAQEYENINIIVSDNYSQDSTKDLVQSFDDKRIQYLNTQRRLSMSENWEFALNHVAEGFVTILGDDDALLPGAIARVASLAKKTSSKAITSSWVNYAWPGSPNENILSIPLKRGYEVRNGDDWLAKLMCGRAVYPQLPFLYTGGFVDLTLIHKARDEDGRFFCSRTPDVYSAIAISAVCQDYIYSYEPFAIAGISKFSNGASSLGISKYEEPSRKFFSENNIMFHPYLEGGERIKSIPVLVYEAYLQAMHLHKNHLSVSLRDQLVIFLKQIKASNKDEIYRFVGSIARREGIELEAYEIKPKSKVLKPKLQKFFNEYFRKVTVEADKFCVRDVFLAAVLANSIMVMRSQYRYYFLKRLIDLSRKILKYFIRVGR